MTSGRRALWIVPLAATAFAVARCGTTQPSSSVMIVKIRYERIYSITAASTARMRIDVSVPSSKRIPFCFPDDTGNNSFVCSALNLMADAGEECWVMVDDPAVGRGVATRVFINDQLVSRVEQQSNGNEFGRFRISGDGRVQ